MKPRNTCQASIEMIVSSARFVGNNGKQPPYCNVPKCARKAATMSLCRAHYFHYHKHRTSKPSVDYMEVLRAAQPRKGKAIKVSERFCHVPKCSREFHALGLCRLHYGRFRKVNHA